MFMLLPLQVKLYNKSDVEEELGGYAVPEDLDIGPSLEKHNPTHQPYSRSHMSVTPRGVISELAFNRNTR